MAKRKEKKRDEGTTTTDLVPMSVRVTGNRGCLEVMTWHGEPAVLMDGVNIIRYSVLQRLLDRFTKSTLVDMVETVEVKS